nr:peptidylprolyl isomerase [Gordonia humi]
MEREKQAAKKRRLSMIAAAGVVVVAIAAVGGYFWWRSWDNGRHAQCTYADAPSDFKAQIDRLTQALPQAPADQKAEVESLIKQLKDGSQKERKSAKPDDRPRNSGTADVTFTTDKGDISIAVDRSTAACNANAFLTLASAGYYDDTGCSQLWNTENIRGLQCGDPTLTGIGAPGWSSPDEPPHGLRTVPIDPQTAQMGSPDAVIYPRGTVAIVNTNAEDGSRTNTGSGNFIIFTKDSKLTPTLAVVGKVDRDGMKIVDQIAAGGIAPGPGSTATNGLPKTQLNITKASVSDDD